MVCNTYSLRAFQDHKKTRFRRANLQREILTGIGFMIAGRSFGELSWDSMIMIWAHHLVRSAGFML